MATAQELERLLIKLTDAAAEAKTAATEAHVARRDLLADVKEARRLVPQQLQELLADVVQQVRDEVREEMRDRMTQVVNGLDADWRQKLGLEPRRA